jgi:hypothetical protein
MVQTSKRPATYADLATVPPHLVAEIVFGNLVTHPRPAPPHALSGNSLSHELTGPFQKGRGGPGGWVFAVEPELHLGPHTVVPDLAGWRRGRMPTMPEKAYIEIPPDWVCEVISPSTEGHDKGPKRRIYATYGVAHLWHLEPVVRLLEVFELRDAHWVLFEVYQGNDEVRAPPFDAVPFAMAGLFPLDPPVSLEPQQKA